MAAPELGVLRINGLRTDRPLRARARMRRAAVVLTFAGVVMALLSAASLGFALPAVIALLFGPALLLLDRLVPPAPLPIVVVAATLQVEGGELRVAAEGAPLRLPLRDIEAGWTEHVARRPLEIHLRTRDGLEVTLVPEAALDGPAVLAVLDALGVGARQRALAVPLLAPAAAIVGARAAAVVVAAVLSPFTTAIVFAAILGVFDGRHGSALAPLAFLGVTVAMIYLAFQTLRAGEVVVGADGVSVRTFLRRRFFPYAAIHAVVDDPWGLAMDVRAAQAPREVVRLRLGRPARPGTIADDAIDAQRRGLGGRIEEARATVRQRSVRERFPAIAAFAAVDAVDASATAFLAQVEKIHEGAPNYRVATLEPAELAFVVEDIDAPARQRIAAALVLARTDPEEAGRAVRVAVDASADELLCEALEQAALGELDARVLTRR